MKRTKVTEWWEIWIAVPGKAPVQRTRYGAVMDPYIPRDGFPTRKGAWFEARLAGKYAKVIHVVRYRRSQ